MQRDSGPQTRTGDYAESNRPDQHYIAFPFALAEKPDGGLPTVILTEARRSDSRRVSIFTTDKPSVSSFDSVRIIPANDPTLTPDLFKRWFATGYWPLLHPKAHTSDAITPKALNAMYPHSLVDALRDKAERLGRGPLGEVGSQPFLHAFVNEHAPSPTVEASLHEEFAKSFRVELERAERHNERVVANFQDYFFLPLVTEVAPLIHKREGFTTLHLHTTIPMIPEELPIPPMIQDLLRAASKVDVVLTHTPIYSERLERMMRRLHLKLPEFRIFDLGVDGEDLQKREGLITAGNYQTAAPDFAFLTARQRAFADACFDAEKSGVPHQFGVFDRLDPGKGIDTVFEAIDSFLTVERSSLSMEELRGRYRFFNLMSQFPDLKNVDPTNMKQTYAAHVTHMGLQLEEKWPGIFLMAEGLSGKQRDLLVALMRGRTVITGGAEDGLNQVVMESSFINRDNPTAVIAGSNIGFVMEMKRVGMEGKLFTFTPGNVEQLAKQLRAVVTYQQREPHYLIGQKEALNKAIMARKASMLVSS